MTDFGIHVVTATRCDTYLNGGLVGRYTHNAYAGGSLLLSAHSEAYPHVDRLEVRDAPGGALLLADDFADLSSWSLGSNGHLWTISPAGFAYGSAGSSGYGIYRGMPVGGTFFELKGVYFDGSGVPDGWVMITPHRQDPLAPSDGPPNEDGFRTLLRPGGFLEMVNGTVLRAGWAGWAIGRIPIGAP